MNAPFKQSERLGRLTTALGPDVLVLLRFDGEDHVNNLFDYRIAALAARDDLDFDALIGTHGSVQIATRDGGLRPFDGIITQARWAGVGENGHRYDLTLRPWFWLAGRRRNQRIFHNKTVVQILQELLADYAPLGDPALEVRLKRDYPVLEYTVQYRESDLDFARRQMERHGISFHFTHAPGSHTLALTDDALAHDSIGMRPFKRYEGHHQFDHEHFRDWAPERRLTTGAMRLTDYNFKKPMQAMETNTVGDAAYVQGKIESFDYPGDYLAQDIGQIVAGLRTQQERGADRRNRAGGDCASLAAGLRVTLGGDSVPGTGETYICLSAHHRFASQAYASGGAGDDEEAFTGSYVLMPDTAPFAPPKITPLAVVQGPQTAVVVGEGEIDCDEYGRILVRFHWDLNAAHSMRCRVSQNWAGNGWGGMVIPRIGMEVVVEFLEGDPDKPLVTGCVYNGRQGRPYPLPEHKTKSVFRSDSHKSSGFNEFTFEDATGAENISLHAQKDQTVKVKNNRSKRIDNDQVESVGRNKAISVGKNHQENIGGSMNLTVGSSGFGAFAALGGIAAAGGQDAMAGSEAVGNTAVSAFVGAVAAVGALTEALTGKAAGSFEAAGNHKAVAGAEQISAGAKLGGLLSSTMPISGVLNTVVEKFVSDTIGLARTEQIGAYKNTSVGHTMTVHVGKEFLINCGKSKFIMDSDGNVTIIGTKFNFSASGNVQINGKVIDLN